MNKEPITSFVEQELRINDRGELMFGEWFICNTSITPVSPKLKNAFKRALVAGVKTGERRKTSDIIKRLGLND